jgi:hypothetical protein
MDVTAHVHTLANYHLPDKGSMSISRTGSFEEEIIGHCEEIIGHYQELIGHCEEIIGHYECLIRSNPNVPVPNLTKQAAVMPLILLGSGFWITLLRAAVIPLRQADQRSQLT